MKLKKINALKIAALAFSLFSTSYVIAMTPDTTDDRAPFTKTFNWNTIHPVFNVSAGFAFNADAGQSANFPATSNIFSFYNYSANRHMQIKPLFGSFLGVEFPLRPKWSLQAGLGYYQPSAFKAKGVVTQGVDVPTSNQYSYWYNIQSQQLLLEGKLMYEWRRFLPYITAGVGTAWNKSKDFTVEISPAFTTLSNQFQSRTVTSFTYSLGFGVDTNVNDYMRVGAGYRFTDLGKARTGTSSIGTVTTNNLLSQNHLYTNELLAQLTFILA